eukprot:jgi/Picsp_1/5798/NSC_03157-R1_hypothetical protein CHLREDRAFT_188919 [Chlamydomonas reinhardtii]
MGGHGGLNILPQKKWNVYGRENRLKVVQDEEKYEEEKREMEEKARMAERESRYNALLSKSVAQYSGRSVVVLQGCAGASGSEARGREEDERRGEVGVDVRGGGSRHFNIFEMQSEDDCGRKKEKEKEERDNVRKRGDAATMTSDARFDQSFRFANNMQGSPWYATAAAAAAAGVFGVDDAGRDGKELARLEQVKDSRRRGYLTREKIVVGRGNSGERRTKEKDAVVKKKRKSSKQRRKDGGHARGFDREKLRKERLEREQGERQRAKYAIHNNNT